MNEDLENILYQEDLTLADVKKRAAAFFIDEMLLSFLLYGTLFLRQKQLKK